MQTITEFLQEAHRIKQWFILFSELNKKYEANKIWARWIITHMSLRKQKNLFFPTLRISNDLQIINELNLKGATFRHALKHYRSLTEQILKLCNDSKETDYSPYELDITATYNDKLVIVDDTDSHTYKCILSRTIYQKLVRLYKHTNIGLDKFTNHSIWKMVNLYNLLDGVSLQWSIPPKLFDYLNQEFDCDTELFASPINSHYKNYYSLFSEDKKFGSRGNFFDAPDSDFKSGCFQINPPFIDILFSKISDKILDYLEIAEDSGEKLTFIYIMPEWHELEGYDILVQSKFCNASISINAFEHYYYQSHKHNYIKVFFNSKVLIMSTEPNICPYYVKRKIVGCFKHPYSF